MSEELTASLTALQLTFLDELASKPDEITQILKDCTISGQRLAGWLADPVFRGAYFVRCAHYEEMHFPAFISEIRRKATGEGKDAAKFATIYMGFIKERSESLLTAAYGNETPPKELEPGKEDDDEAEPEVLSQESVSELLGR